MAYPNPPPRLPDIIPHEVTKGEINIAHAPQSSPTCTADALVANLFGDLRGFTPLNKHLSSPKETTGLTHARKKHGGTTRRASSVKARGVIQMLLAAELSSLRIEDSFDGCTELSNLHRKIRTPDGGDTLHESDDEDYHPESVLSFDPPQRQHNNVHKKTSKPKLVIDKNFMCFLRPGTFDNQPFRKCKEVMYSVSEMDRFDTNFRKQLHFNFSATRKTQKQR